MSNNQNRINVEAVVTPDQASLNKTRAAVQAAVSPKLDASTAEALTQELKRTTDQASKLDAVMDRLSKNAGTKKVAGSDEAQALIKDAQKALAAMHALDQAEPTVEIKTNAEQALQDLNAVAERVRSTGLLGAQATKQFDAAIRKMKLPELHLVVSRIDLDPGVVERAQGEAQRKANRKDLTFKAGVEVDAAAYAKAEAEVTRIAAASAERRARLQARYQDNKERAERAAADRAEAEALRVQRRMERINAHAQGVMMRGQYLDHAAPGPVTSAPFGLVEPGVAMARYAAKRTERQWDAERARKERKEADRAARELRETERIAAQKAADAPKIDAHYERAKAHEGKTYESAKAAADHERAFQEARARERRAANDRLRAVARHLTLTDNAGRYEHQEYLKYLQAFRSRQARGRPILPAQVLSEVSRQMAAVSIDAEPYDELHSLRNTHAQMATAAKRLKTHTMSGGELRRLEELMGIDRNEALLDNAERSKRGLAPLSGKKQLTQADLALVMEDRANAAARDVRGAERRIARQEEARPGLWNRFQRERVAAADRPAPAHDPWDMEIHRQNDARRREREAIEDELNRSWNLAAAAAARDVQERRDQGPSDREVAANRAASEASAPDRRAAGKPDSHEKKASLLQARRERDKLRRDRAAAQSRLAKSIRRNRNPYTPAGSDPMRDSVFHSSQFYDRAVSEPERALDEIGKPKEGVVDGFLERSAALRFGKTINKTDAGRYTILHKPEAMAYYQPKAIMDQTDFMLDPFAAASQIVAGVDKSGRPFDNRALLKSWGITTDYAGKDASFAIPEASPIGGYLERFMPALKKGSKKDGTTGSYHAATGTYHVSTSVMLRALQRAKAGPAQVMSDVQASISPDQFYITPSNSVLAKMGSEATLHEMSGLHGDVRTLQDLRAFDFSTKANIDQNLANQAQVAAAKRLGGFLGEYRSAGRRVQAGEFTPDQAIEHLVNRFGNDRTFVNDMLNGYQNHDPNNRGAREMTLPHGEDARTAFLKYLKTSISDFIPQGSGDAMFVPAARQAPIALSTLYDGLNERGAQERANRKLFYNLKPRLEGPRRSVKGMKMVRAPLGDGMTVRNAQPVAMEQAFPELLEILSEAEKLKAQGVDPKTAVAKLRDRYGESWKNRLSTTVIADHEKSTQTIEDLKKLETLREENPGEAAKAIRSDDGRRVVSTLDEILKARRTYAASALNLGALYGIGSGKKSAMKAGQDLTNKTYSDMWSSPVFRRNKADQQFAVGMIEMGGVVDGDNRKAYKEQSAQNGGDALERILNAAAAEGNSEMSDNLGGTRARSGIMHVDINGEGLAGRDPVADLRALEAKQARQQRTLETRAQRVKQLRAYMEKLPKGSAEYNRYAREASQLVRGTKQGKEVTDSGMEVRASVLHARNKAIENQRAVVEQAESSSFYQLDPRAYTPFTLEGKQWTGVEHYRLAQQYVMQPEQIEMLREAQRTDPTSKETRAMTARKVQLDSMYEKLSKAFSFQHAQKIINTEAAKAGEKGINPLTPVKLTDEQQDEIISRATVAKFSSPIQRDSGMPWGEYLRHKLMSTRGAAIRIGNRRDMYLGKTAIAARAETTESYLEGLHDELTATSDFRHYDGNSEPAGVRPKKAGAYAPVGMDSAESRFEAARKRADELKAQAEAAKKAEAEKQAKADADMKAFAEETRRKNAEREAVIAAQAEIQKTQRPVDATTQTIIPEGKRPRWPRQVKPKAPEAQATPAEPAKPLRDPVLDAQVQREEAARQVAREAQRTAEEQAAVAARAQREAQHQAETDAALAERAPRMTRRQLFEAARQMVAQRQSPKVGQPADRAEPVTRPRWPKQVNKQPIPQVDIAAEAKKSQEAAAKRGDQPVTASDVNSGGKIPKETSLNDLVNNGTMRANLDQNSTMAATAKLSQKVGEMAGKAKQVAPAGMKETVPDLHAPETIAQQEEIDRALFLATDALESLPKVTTYTKATGGAQTEREKNFKESRERMTGRFRELRFKDGDKAKKMGPQGPTNSGTALKGVGIDQMTRWNEEYAQLEGFVKDNAQSLEGAQARARMTELSAKMQHHMPGIKTGRDEINIEDLQNLSATVDTLRAQSKDPALSPEHRANAASRLAKAEALAAQWMQGAAPGAASFKDGRREASAKAGFVRGDQMHVNRAGHRPFQPIQAGEGFVQEDFLYTHKNQYVNNNPYIRTEHFDQAYNELLRTGNRGAMHRFLGNQRDRAINNSEYQWGMRARVVGEQADESLVRNDFFGHKSSSGKAFGRVDADARLRDRQAANQTIATKVGGDLKGLMFTGDGTVSTLQRMRDITNMSSTELAALEPEILKSIKQYATQMVTAPQDATRLIAQARDELAAYRTKKGGLQEKAQVTQEELLQMSLRSGGPQSVDGWRKLMGDNVTASRVAQADRLATLANASPEQLWSRRGTQREALVDTMRAVSGLDVTAMGQLGSAAVERIKELAQGVQSGGNMAEANLAARRAIDGDRLASERGDAGADARRRAFNQERDALLFGRNGDAVTARHWTESVRNDFLSGQNLSGQNPSATVVAPGMINAHMGDWNRRTNNGGRSTADSRFADQVREDFAGGTNHTGQNARRQVFDGPELDGTMSRWAGDVTLRRQQARQAIGAGITNMAAFAAGSALQNGVMQLGTMGQDAMQAQQILMRARRVQGARTGSDRPVQPGVDGIGAARDISARAAATIGGTQAEAAQLYVELAKGGTKSIAEIRTQFRQLEQVSRNTGLGIAELSAAMKSLNDAGIRDAPEFLSKYAGQFRLSPEDLTAAAQTASQSGYFKLSTQEEREQIVAGMADSKSTTFSTDLFVASKEAERLIERANTLKDLRMGTGMVDGLAQWYKANLSLTAAGGQLQNLVANLITLMGPFVGILVGIATATLTAVNAILRLVNMVPGLNIFIGTIAGIAGVMAAASAATAWYTGITNAASVAQRQLMAARMAENMGAITASIGRATAAIRAMTMAQIISNAQFRISAIQGWFTALIAGFRAGTLGATMMGTAVWTALAPLMPVILALAGAAAVIGAVGYVAGKVYNENKKNTESDTKSTEFKELTDIVTDNDFATLADGARGAKGSKGGKLDINDTGQLRRMAEIYQGYHDDLLTAYGHSSDKVREDMNRMSTDGTEEMKAYMEAVKDLGAEMVGLEHAADAAVNAGTRIEALSTARMRQQGRTSVAARLGLDSAWALTDADIEREANREALTAVRRSMKTTMDRNDWTMEDLKEKSPTAYIKYNEEITQRERNDVDMTIKAEQQRADRRRAVNEKQSNDVSRLAGESAILDAQISQLRTREAEVNMARLLGQTTVDARNIEDQLVALGKQRVQNERELLNARIAQTTELGKHQALWEAIRGEDDQGSPVDGGYSLDRANAGLSQIGSAESRTDGAVMAWLMSVKADAERMRKNGTPEQQVEAGVRLKQVNGLISQAQEFDKNVGGFNAQIAEITRRMQLPKGSLEFLGVEEGNRLKSEVYEKLKAANDKIVAAYNEMAAKLTGGTGDFAGTGDGTTKVQTVTVTPATSGDEVAIPITRKQALQIVDGTVTQDTHNHDKAVDVGAREGKDVLAPVNGTMKLVEFGKQDANGQWNDAMRYDHASMQWRHTGAGSAGSYGLQAVVTGEDGVTYRISHLSREKAQLMGLKPGQEIKVQAGQMIGGVGHSGNSVTRNVYSGSDLGPNHAHIAVTGTGPARKAVTQQVVTQGGFRGKSDNAAAFAASLGATIDPAALYAFFNAESSLGTDKRVSWDKNATVTGWGQVTKAAQDQVNKTYKLKLDRTKEGDNMRISALYLDYLGKQFKTQDPELLYALYNYGEGNVRANMKRNGGKFVIDQSVSAVKRQELTVGTANVRKGLEMYKGGKTGTATIDPKTGGLSAIEQQLKDQQDEAFRAWKESNQAVLNTNEATRRSTEALRAVREAGVGAGTTTEYNRRVAEAQYSADYAANELRFNQKVGAIKLKYPNLNDPTTKKEYDAAMAGAVAERDATRTSLNIKRTDSNDGSLVSGVQEDMKIAARGVVRTLSVMQKQLAIVNAAVTRAETEVDAKGRTLQQRRPDKYQELLDLQGQLNTDIKTRSKEDRLASLGMERSVNSLYRKATNQAVGTENSALTLFEQIRDHQTLSESAKVALGVDGEKVVQGSRLDWAIRLGDSDNRTRDRANLLDVDRTHQLDKNRKTLWRYDYAGKAKEATAARANAEARMRKEFAPLLASGEMSEDALYLRLEPLIKSERNANNDLEARQKLERQTGRQLDDMDVSLGTKWRGQMAHTVQQKIDELTESFAFDPNGPEMKRLQGQLAFAKTRDAADLAYVQAGRDQDKLGLTNEAAAFEVFKKRVADKRASLAGMDPEMLAQAMHGDDMAILQQQKGFDDARKALNRYDASVGLTWLGSMGTAAQDNFDATKLKFGAGSVEAQQAQRQLNVANARDLLDLERTRSARTRATLELDSQSAGYEEAARSAQEYLRGLAELNLDSEVFASLSHETVTQLEQMSRAFVRAAEDARRQSDATDRSAKSLRALNAIKVGVYDQNVGSVERRVTQERSELENSNASEAEDLRVLREKFFKEQNLGAMLDAYGSKLTEGDLAYWQGKFTTTDQGQRVFSGTNLERASLQSLLMNTVGASVSGDAAAKRTQISQNTTTELAGSLRDLTDDFRTRGFMGDLLNPDASESAGDRISQRLTAITDTEKALEGRDTDQIADYSVLTERAGRVKTMLTSLNTDSGRSLIERMVTSRRAQQDAQLDIEAAVSPEQRAQAEDKLQSLRTEYGGLLQQLGLLLPEELKVLSQEVFGLNSGYVGALSERLNNLYGLIDSVTDARLKAVEQAFEQNKQRGDVVSASLTYRRDAGRELGQNLLTVANRPRELAASALTGLTGKNLAESLALVSTDKQIINAQQAYNSTKSYGLDQLVGLSPDQIQQQFKDNPELGKNILSLIQSLGELDRTVRDQIAQELFRRQFEDIKLARELGQRRSAPVIQGDGAEQRAQVREAQQWVSSLEAMQGTALGSLHWGELQAEIDQTKRQIISLTDELGNRWKMVTREMITDLVSGIKGAFVSSFTALAKARFGIRTEEDRQRDKTLDQVDTNVGTQNALLSNAREREKYAREQLQRGDLTKEERAAWQTALTTALTDVARYSDSSIAAKDTADFEHRNAETMQEKLTNIWADAVDKMSTNFLDKMGGEVFDKIITQNANNLLEQAGLIEAPKAIMLDSSAFLAAVDSMGVNGKLINEQAAAVVANFNNGAQVIATAATTMQSAASTLASAGTGAGLIGAAGAVGAAGASGAPAPGLDGFGVSYAPAAGLDTGVKPQASGFSVSGSYKTFSEPKTQMQAQGVPTKPTALQSGAAMAVGMIGSSIEAPKTGNVIIDHGVGIAKNALIGGAMGLITGAGGAAAGTGAAFAAGAGAMLNPVTLAIGAGLMVLNKQMGFMKETQEYARTHQFKQSFQGTDDFGIKKGQYLDGTKWQPAVTVNVQQPLSSPSAQREVGRQINLRSAVQGISLGVNN